jgi:hypothetical protein
MLYSFELKIYNLSLKNITVRPYCIEDFELWNVFVSQAKNATFLFHRNFMDYHADRFQDYSLLIFDKKTLVAILPANRNEQEVFSHQGLSYGGLVVKKNFRIKNYIQIFKCVLQYLNDQGVENLSIKVLPKIYNSALADEIDYISYLTKAKTYRCDAYLVLEDNVNYKTNRNRSRALAENTNNEIVIKKETDYTDFWNLILTPNLINRFQTKPVHSLGEISKLAALFPDEIQLFNAYYKGVLKAGVVMFVMNDVAHFQYSSGTDDRNEIPALDHLFDWIIKHFKNKKYISFGCSSENNGLQLNEGLTYWKESFGAVATVQNYIRIETKNFHLLEQF